MPKKQYQKFKDWESVKPEIEQFFIQEDNTLQATRAEFARTHGNLAGTRTWNQKLKEWGFNKYNKKRKWSVEDNPAPFLHGDARNTIEEFQPFKRPRRFDESAYVPILPRYQQSTPGLEMTVDETEFIQDQDTPCDFLNSAPSTVSISDSDFPSPPASGLRLSPTPMANIQDERLTSVLEQYLWDEERPWSSQELFHQVENHDTTMKENKDRLASLLKFLGLTENPSTTLEFSSATNGFLLGADATSMSEELDEISEEEAALEKLLDQAASLLEYQLKLGEFSERALREEFKLAKAAERNNLYQEAEHHCRRILGQYPYPDVQTFLGLIFARSSRFEGSLLLLCWAIAGLIAQSEEASHHMTSSLLHSINLLCREMFLQSGLDWISVTTTIWEVMKQIERTETEEDFEKLLPALINFGIDIARESIDLGMVDLAKNIFQSFLEYAAPQLQSTDYRTWVVEIYLEYGALLRADNSWKASADNLLLACRKAAIYGIHDRSVISRLEDEYKHLLPKLIADPNLGRSMTKEIRKELDKLIPQSSLHLEENDADARVSQLAQFLLLDPPFVNLRFTEHSQMSTSELSSAFERIKVSAEHPSTLSTAESYRYGVTMSKGQISDISDGIYSWALGKA